MEIGRDVARTDNVVVASAITPPERSIEALHKRFSPILVYLAGYAFLLSYLYLEGFWDAFGINVFEYLGINDVVTLGLAHAGWVVAFVAGVLGTPTLWRAEPPATALTGRQVRVGAWVRRHFSTILFAWMVAAIAVMILHTWWLWLSLGVFLIGTPVAVLADYALGRLSSIPEKPRLALCLVLALLPPLYYARGLQEAATIKSWTRYQCVATASLPGLFVETSASGPGCVRYLGMADGYAFLLLNDSVTYQVVKLDQAKGLRLTPAIGRPAPSSARATPPATPALPSSRGT